MSAVIPELFKGVAVVIDNGIGTEAAIDAIMKEIAASGGYTLPLLALPADDADLDHFANAAFFIMDWNLGDSEPLPAGLMKPAGLADDQIQRNVAFLKRLSKSRHAPVFIFTNEEPSTVLEALQKDPDLFVDAEQSHILVKRKSDVQGAVYEVLEKWGRDTPSVLTLKTWERSHLKAVNALFVDLHNKTPYWPVLLWQTFKEDSVPAGVELGRLITRLVASRMQPLNLDLSGFEPTVNAIQDASPKKYSDALYKVLEGERFVRDDRLVKDVMAPGDVFMTTENNETVYLLNVRPECDCILRGKAKHVDLYLLSGKAIKDVQDQIDPTFGTLPEQDNEAVVFAMYEGISIRFKLRRLRIAKSTDFKDKRIGRLLPPFVTRVQQRHAAYTQRPGIPRIPTALRPRIGEQAEAQLETTPKMSGNQVGAAEPPRTSAATSTA